MHDLGARQAAGVDLRSGVAGDAARKFRAARVANPHDLASAEASCAFFDTRWQEAFAAFAQRLPRSVIHGQRALRAMEEGDPAFASLELAGLRNEERT